MSASVNRRTFTLGSLAAAIGGSAVLALPTVRLAAAQDTTADPAEDLTNLGLPTLDITVNADNFDGAPTSDLAAGRYFLSVRIADEVEVGGAAFMSPPTGMSAEDFMTQVGIGGGGSTPPDAGAPASPPAGEEGEEGGEMLPLFVYQAHFAGGAMGPGGMTSLSVIDLPPGEWILWGDDPTAPQQPVTFNVTGDMPADLPEPAADVTITLIDFAIEMPESLSAGMHLVKMQNHGAQPHFIVVEKGPDSMTNDQIAEILESDMSMPATPADLPFDPNTDLMPVAQTATQSIGTEQWVPMLFEAGTYAAMCFFPTAGEGAPHAMHGMHTVFTVQ